MSEEKLNDLKPTSEKEKRSRVFRNMASYLFYNLTIFVFGLILPRLYLTNFGSEVNGLVNTVKQVFVCLALLEAGVGLSSQHALYYPVAIGDRESINGIFAATSRYYIKTGYIYSAITLLFALVYPLTISIDLDFLTVSMIIVFYGLPGILSYFIQGRYRPLLEVDGKMYIMTNLVTATMIVGNILRLLTLIYTDNLLLIQFTYVIPTILQILFLLIYVKKKYSWLSTKVKPNYPALGQKRSVLVHQVSEMVFNNTDTILISVINGLKSASIYAIYTLFYSNFEKIIFSVVGSMSFKLGQLFQTDRKRFLERFEIFETFFIMLTSVLYTVIAAFILPIIQLYTRGVGDANYISVTLVILFATSSVLNAAKTPCSYVVTYAGKFRETQHHALTEMIINLMVSIVAAFFLGIAGCLIGTIAALLYRNAVLTVFVNRKVFGRNPFCTYRKLLVNTLCCAGVLLLLGIQRPGEGDTYFRVIIRAGLNGIWILVLFASMNLLVERRAYGYVLQDLKKALNRRGRLEGR